LIPGLPITETALQVSGPRLIGSGSVSDTRFSAAPTTNGIGDVSGDALYPVQGGTNVPQLDLTGSRIEWDGTNLLVHISAANLASLMSPDTANQNEVWWLTTWQFDHKVYFAKAQSILGQAPVCTAGIPKSFDRPGLNGQTVATLVDYGASTLAPTASASTVQCQQKGNEFVITVPPSDVGGPSAGSVLEAVTGFSLLDNGAPPCLIGSNAPGDPTPAPCDNIPTITDATAAYNAILAPPSANVPEFPMAPLVIGLTGLVAAGGYAVRRRRAAAG